MSEVLYEYDHLLEAPDGTELLARACGYPTELGLWEAFIELIPIHGGNPLRTGRETTQPNRVDAVYWATGLSRVYLEGALHRIENAEYSLTEPSDEHAPAE
jgi:hypothetical protein